MYIFFSIIYRKRKNDNIYIFKINKKGDIWQQTFEKEIVLRRQNFLTENFAQNNGLKMP